MQKQLLLLITFTFFAGVFLCEGQAHREAAKSGTLSTSTSSGGGAAGDPETCHAFISVPSRLLCTDSSITLSSDANGVNPQWFLDSLTNPIIGETGNSLIVTKPGIYYFGVAGPGGQFCYDGVVITPVVALDTIPQISTFCQPGSATLFAPSLSTSNYQWYKDSVLVPGAISNTYTEANTGNYFVKFTTTNKCALSSETINTNVVSTLPQSNITDKKSADGLGDSLTLNITSDDLYPANITWYDPGNNVIKSIDNKGIIVAGGNNLGSALNQLSTPYGIFLDSVKNIYVADNGNSRIMKWALGSTTGEDILDILPIDGPNGSDPTPASVNDVLVDRSSLYVSTSTILTGFRFYNVGGIFNYFSPPSPDTLRLYTANSWGLAFDSKKNIYSSFDPEPFNTSVVDPSGKIVISDGGVRKVTSKDQVSFTDQPVSNPASINYPNGICVDAGNNIYVADNLSDTRNNNYGRIVKWAPGATIGELVAGGKGFGNAPDQIAFAAGVTLDAAGNIYVSDAVNNRVQLWKPGSDHGINIANGFRPWGIKVDDSSNVYVADQTNNQVLKFPSLFHNSIKAGGPGVYKAVVTYPGGCTTSADFTVGSSPITILNFAGKLKNKNVLLTWQTTSQFNNASFTIQRSLNGTNFTSIGTVNASGNSSLNSYSFTDNNVTDLNVSKIYYQINEIGTDGASVQSNVISIVVNKIPWSFTVSPNPVTSSLKVHLINAFGKTNVALIDLFGRKLASQDIIAKGYDDILFNTTDLRRGLYFIRVINSGQTKYLLFIKG